jgi:hypothetical protein
MSIPRFEDLPPGIFTAIDELPAVQFPRELPPNPILPPSPVFETNPAVPIIDTLFGDPGGTPAVEIVALPEQAHEHTLPQQALQQIVSAGALEHLPDPIAPTITRDAEVSQTVFGQDGIHDIFVFDADNLGSEIDALVNWDPGEDILAIVNFTEDDVVVVSVNIKTQVSSLNINDIDVASCRLATYSRWLPRSTTTRSRSFDREAKKRTDE